MGKRPSRTRVNGNRYLRTGKREQRARLGQHVHLQPTCGAWRTCEGGPPRIVWALQKSGHVVGGKQLGGPCSPSRAPPSFSYRFFTTHYVASSSEVKIYLRCSFASELSRWPAPIRAAARSQSLLFQDIATGPPDSAILVSTTSTLLNSDGL